MYIPALLYRWNIKASSWLWGPVALALRPVVWASDEAMRVNMSWHSTYPLLRGMLTVILFVGLWLLGAFLPEVLASEMPAWLSKLTALLPEPALNVRTSLLALTLLAWLLLVVFAYRLRAAHDKPLGDADNLKKYDDELKASFRRLAKPVRISGQLTAALMFMTVWTYALAWALERWPEPLQLWVWDWLKACL